MEEPHNKTEHKHALSIHFMTAFNCTSIELVCILLFIKTQVLVSLFLFSLTARTHYVFRQYDHFDVFLMKQMIMIHFALLMGSHKVVT